MKYIVIELQTTNGTTGNFVFAFDSLADAEAKYHEILSYAAKSAVAVHACVMLGIDGFEIKHECYMHEEQVPGI